ncbi:MAG: hypothetical protein ACLQVF_43050, partial [Isosphaeraceae bacterium]
LLRFAEAARNWRHRVAPAQEETGKVFCCHAEIEDPQGYEETIQDLSHREGKPQALRIVTLDES